MSMAVIIILFLALIGDFLAIASTNFFFLSAWFGGLEASSSKAQGDPPASDGGRWHHFPLTLSDFTCNFIFTQRKKHLDI
jgi:hypothetical protein